MNIQHILTALSQHPEGTFLSLDAFNGHAFGACRITGESSIWEMHPDTDEFFHILEGELEMTLLEDETPSVYIVSAGSIFVIPQGVWHKPSAPNGVQLMYFTPGETLHSEAEDPRSTP